MAAPSKSKVVKTTGKWKKVEIDPNLLADEKFESLISCEELTDYDISEGNTTKSRKLKKTNAWVVREIDNTCHSNQQRNDPQLSASSAKKGKTKNLTQIKSNQKSKSETKLPTNEVTSQPIVLKNAQSNNEISQKQTTIANEETTTTIKSKKTNLNTKCHNEMKVEENSRKKSNNVTAKKRTNKFKNDEISKRIKTDDSTVDISNIDMSTWNGLMVPPPVLNALATNGFTSPMPIQALALPPAIRDGKDIMGAAETGSGKTLAFGIPLLHYILRWKDFEAKKTETKDEAETTSPVRTPLLGLVLTPTRELAVQVKGHIEAAAKFTGVQPPCVAFFRRMTRHDLDTSHLSSLDHLVVVLLGGMSAQKQQRILKRCPEIVIATPGRLWELIQMEEPHLSQLDDLKCLVIDEADRMVERGHFQELTKLLDLLNENKEVARRRHTYVYSATLTMEHMGNVGWRKKKRPVKENTLEALMGRIGVKPSAKIIDLTNKSVTANTLVEARITCSVHEKDIHLYHFVTHHPGRTLVFTNSKDCIRRLQSVFSLLSCNPLPLHADMHQKQRLKNLERFTANESVLLLATDVAARGLDIPDVQHVIHYQVPRTVENYVHRSGRTARVYKEGLSVMLVSPDDAANYRKIVLQVSKGEDLPQFPTEMKEISQIRPRVDLAQQIDKLEHRSQKMKRENDWFIKAAKDMDMDIDDDNQILHNYKQKDDNQVKKRLKVMKAELGHLLNQPLGTTDYMGKYPTHRGKFHDPRISVARGDAITQVKERLAEKPTNIAPDRGVKRSARKDKYRQRKKARAS